jgi:hypothetical protein
MGADAKTAMIDEHAAEKAGEGSHKHFIRSCQCYELARLSFSRR